jgi:hypothetical protein
MTLVGGLVIAASGLYTAHRERIRAREARLPAAGIYRSEFAIETPPESMHDDAN